MIDDQIHGHQRFDDSGIAARANHGGTQAGQIHHARDAGQVLQQDTGGKVGDFIGGIGAGLPAGEGFHVVPLIGGVGLVAQGGLQENANDVGELGKR